MFINPDIVVAITTVPLQLTQAAEAYDDAAARLHGVRTTMPEYLGQLELAEQVNWDSMASESYRSVLQLLKVPGKLMILELSALAAEARSIADDLRGYAQQAQNLMSLLTGFSASMPVLDTAWEMVSERFQAAWQEATSALDGDAAQFVEFIDRHGGIPQIIEQGARHVLRPW